MHVTAPLPPEFILAAACCRWPPGAARDAAVRAASVGLDWDRFLRICKRQRVEGLAQAALTAAGVALPEPAARTLAQRAERILRRNLASAAETVRLQTCLDAAGIPVLALKGMALAQLAYGSLALKYSQDIDLLVGADQADAAITVLERQGYALRQPLSPAQRRILMRYAGEVALIHLKTRAVVELRWRLADSATLLQGIDTAATGRTVALSGTVGIRTLRDEDQFAYLCLHGAGHGWSRLQWLADLNAFIGASDDAAIMRLYDSAQARGTGVCAGLALLLCHRLLGRELPAELAGALTRSRRLRILAALSMAAMVGADAETELQDRPFGSTRVAALQFLLGGGWRNVVAQCRTISFRLDDMLRLPLPAPLHGLYPLLRLPLWLWRRVLRRPA